MSTEGTIMDSTLNNALPVPVIEECLACYLDRAMYTASCDGTLRAIEYFAETVAPSQHPLATVIKADGIHCDCEYRMNASRVAGTAERDARGRITCQGTSTGSLTPCPNWS
ncbi:DUF2695 domain-containing protein [Glutamicibacter sp. 363]